jgi:hypothetical protein
MSTFGISSSILFVLSRFLGIDRDAPRDFLNFLTILGNNSLVTLGTDFEFLECDTVEADLQDGCVVLVRCDAVRRS